METKSKRNLLIWSVILLVLLNLTSLATIWFHRFQNKASFERTEKVNRHVGDKKRSINNSDRLSKYLGRDLHLTSDQRQKFDSTWSYYAVQKLDYEQQLHSNRFEMSEIMSEINPDTTQFYTLSLEQGKILQQLDRSMLSLNIAMRETLDTDQMETFRQNIKKLNSRRFNSGRRDASAKRKKK